MIRLLALLALVLFVRPAAAASIIDAAAAVDAITRGAIVWDVRDAASYQQGHLPGAIQVPEADAVLRLPGPQQFNDLVRVEKILGDAGLDLKAEIVVYGNRGSPAAYAALAALRYYGATRVAIFHDGIDGWREAGRALGTGEIRRPAATVQIMPNPALTATTAEVLARLKAPDVQILDVRTPAEYAGLDVRAARGGHIPGALNIPFEQNWVDPEAAIKLARRQATDTRGMALKPEADLRRLYAGLDPAKEIIVYCQTGGRAAVTVGVLKELGFSKVRLYKPSWAGWAAQPDAPVETGAAAPAR